MEYIKESISFELGFIVLISSNLYVMNLNTDVINFSTKKLKQKKYSIDSTMINHYFIKY